MTTKILVVAHRDFNKPIEDMYIPIFVGNSKINKDGIHDNTGDNISFKNQYYCELTALYWAWKNLQYDILGLVHYRRYFSNSKSKNILSESTLNSLITKADIILPKKQKYYIETLFSHYSHTHNKEHLLKTRIVIEKLHPDYMKYYDKTLNQRSGYMFNMFIMRKELVNDYCLWLFPILEELEKIIDTTNLSNFDKRLFGRISELLFNVWINKKKKQIKTKTINIIYMGSVNWIKKIVSFIKAKLFHKEYKTSF